SYWIAQKKFRREKKETWLAWHGRAGNVPSDIHLRPALCHAFRDGKDLVGNLLVHVILAAVFADLGGDVLYDECHAVPVKGDGCRAFPGLAVPADNALHVLLHPSSPSHSTTQIRPGRISGWLTVPAPIP